MTKICTNCFIEKDFSQFYKDARFKIKNKTGCISICKICIKVRYSSCNKEYKKNYLRKRRKEDFLFRLKNNLGSLVRHAFKNNNIRKRNRTLEIIGCDPISFKKHIDHKFEDWMSWENHGLYNGTVNYGWDLDHIIPISLAKTEEEIIKLNHYTNFQPLCTYKNRCIKINKLIY